MKISYSKLKKCTNCMHQYKLYYIDGWRRKYNKAIYAFGNACHKIVTDSLVNRFRIDPADAFVMQWHKYQKCKLHYNKDDSFEKFIEIGRQLCGQIPHTLKSITAICDIENHFMVRFGSIHLNGYIDFTGRYKRRQTLFEIKTVRSFADHEVDMSDQLTLYSMVRGIPQVGIVAFIKTKTDPHIEIHTGTKTKTDYINLKRKTVKAVNDILHKYYPKANNKMTCQMCDFLPICFGTKSEVKAKLRQIDIQYHTRNIRQRRKKTVIW